MAKKINFFAISKATLFIAITLIGIGQSIERMPKTITLRFLERNEQPTEFALRSVGFSQRYFQLEEDIWLYEEGNNREAFSVSPVKIENFIKIFMQKYSMILVERSPSANNRLSYYGLDETSSLIVSVTGEKKTVSLMLGLQTALGSEVFALYNDDVYRIALTELYPLLET